VTTVGLAENLAVEEDCGEFPHVVGGVVLIGAAACLARMLDRGFLDGAGWDPRTRVLSLPAQHRLFGPDGVPGRRMPEHRPFRSHGVSSVLHAPDSAGNEQVGDRRCRMPARRTRVPDAMCGVGMPVRADGATRGGVRAARQEVPPVATTDVDETVPGRPASAAVAADARMLGGGVSRPADGAGAATATPTTSAGGQRWPPTPRWIPTGGEPPNRVWPSPGR
jgi:hypothetical protein